MDRIEIELGMWEAAPAPICTDNVDLDTAEKMLYLSAVTEWGERDTIRLLNHDGHEKWERFQEWLCAEEEAIVIECGGIYYEDMCDEEEKKLI
jgi:hypothetical protein